MNYVRDRFVATTKILPRYLTVHIITAVCSLEVTHPFNSFINRIDNYDNHLAYDRVFVIFVGLFLTFYIDS